MAWKTLVCTQATQSESRHCRLDVIACNPKLAVSPAAYRYKPDGMSDLESLEVSSRTNHSPGNIDMR
jgi:hypothetical protein